MNADFYDITADDQRFLMARPLGNSVGVDPTLIFVQNWFEELRQRMGGN